MQYNDYYVVGFGRYYSVFIATGNSGMIMSYSYHGNTIFKVMLSPERLYVALHGLADNKCFCKTYHGALAILAQFAKLKSPPMLF